MTEDTRLLFTTYNGWETYPSRLRGWRVQWHCCWGHRLTWPHRTEWWKDSEGSCGGKSKSVEVKTFLLPVTKSLVSSRESSLTEEEEEELHWSHSGEICSYTPMCKKKTPISTDMGRLILACSFHWWPRPSHWLHPPTFQPVVFPPLFTSTCPQLLTFALAVALWARPWGTPSLHPPGS